MVGTAGRVGKYALERGEDVARANIDTQARQYGGAMSGGGKSRHAIVKQVMQEHGLSLPHASKYVKEHGLYVGGAKTRQHVRQFEIEGAGFKLPKSVTKALKSTGKAVAGTAGRVGKYALQRGEDVAMANIDSTARRMGGAMSGGAISGGAISGGAMSGGKARSRRIRNVDAQRSTASIAEAKMAPKSKARKPNARNLIVKKIMQQRGVSMIEASKIVKAEGLY